MTDFTKYHNANSRDDINRLFSTITDESKFYKNTQNKQTFSIQYERLTPAFDHLNFLEKERKEYFEISRLGSCTITYVFAIIINTKTDKVMNTTVERHSTYNY